MMLELLTSCENSMEYEEMLLNVIAALTNLTFYSCQVSYFTLQIFSYGW